ncbi:LysE family translocator [Nitratidesulfovibrio liaohensis]|uniref:LysE family translocator n=1 Tax=Nitratidesulfovibrio liaohensis TaxID=2604158 RepID=A0ABY9QZK3_9BACT|nr:LysE family translocator [Nitratidesulfovibrio liaohensis]WMW64929.1 LysE family translocator [Nitratidesulfovibrio liaohensis]
MHGVHDIWLFVVSGLLLNITPGPDMLYIIARSTTGGTHGLRAGVAAALGIGAGCSVHIAAAAFGLSAVLTTSATAFTVVKLLGAAYLLYMGCTMLLARKGTARTAAPGSLDAAAPGGHEQAGASTAQPPQATLRGVFAQGFLTNALNPKVALFFLAFLPQFVDGGGTGAPPSSLAFLVLGCIFTINGTLVNLLVAWGASRLGSIFQTGALAARFARWGDRCLGALFLLLGIRLALAERG